MDREVDGWIDRQMDKYMGTCSACSKSLLADLLRLA